MMKHLNKKTISELGSEVIVPKTKPSKDAAILHFGIGGFNRSHQAYALQQLVQLNEEIYGEWNICGVCILPHDRPLVEKFRKQDLLYSLRISATGMKEEVMIMNIITELLYGPEDATGILQKIASDSTKIVSFTITEGGYNIDEATGEFLLNNPDIKHDLDPANTPKTVFGYLARGLKSRRDNGMGQLTLMSCDNIQENGDVLKKALYSFINKYDQSLIDYLESSVSFPNGMVDRITPVTKDADRKKLEDNYQYKDDCLVVCEPFFQWVIEKEDMGSFPPLDKVGVTFVDDVRPYERMKLGILNGGHTLVGLVGKALGYTYIHDAVNDKNISALFTCYNEYEVIPSLATLNNVNYNDYVKEVKARFGNAMINDSTDRIISGSTAKIPKFILPIILDQIAKNGSATIGALIIAFWWHYLDQQISAGKGDAIDDPAKDMWLKLFTANTPDTLSSFIATKEVFGTLSANTSFKQKVQYFADLIRNEGVSHACEQALKSCN